MSNPHGPISGNLGMGSKFHHETSMQKVHSTLQWVQEKSLHHKNQEINQAQLMFKMISYKNYYFVPTIQSGVVQRESLAAAPLSI